MGIRQRPLARDEGIVGERPADGKAHRASCCVARSLNARPQPTQVPSTSVHFHAPSVLYTGIDPTPPAPLAGRRSHHVHYKRITRVFDTGRRGGMVYAAVSKTAALTGLRVRVPSPAPIITRKISGVSASRLTPLPCLRALVYATAHANSYQALARPFVAQRLLSPRQAMDCSQC